MTAMTLRDVPSWPALADLYGKVAHDDEAARIVLDEARRRERAERDARRRKLEVMRYEDAVQAQLEDATRACGGQLINPRYRESGPRDERMLWRGPEATARRFASWELNAYWDANPRVTFTQYQQQERDGRRIQRDEYDAETIQGETVTEHQAAEAVPATDRAPSPLTYEERKAAALANARESVAQRAAEIRQEIKGTAAAQVAVRAPAAFIRQRETPDAVALLRRVLDGIGLLLTDYVAFPTRAGVIASVLWIAQAAARDPEGDLIWRAYVRLLVTSRQNGSGKSTLGDLISMLLQCQAGRMSKVTPYGLTKVLGTLKEAAIADDAQNVFRSDKAGTELLTIMINGYTRGATWVTGKSDGKIEPASGPVMIIGKDELITKRADYLRDLIDRSAVVRLERPDRYMPEVDEEAEARAKVLAAALKAVMGSLQPHLREAARELAEENRGRLITDGDGGRTAQIWRPMLAVARVAGGPWPDAAQQAMEELSAASGDLLKAEDAIAGLESLDGSGDAGRSFWEETS